MVKTAEDKKIANMALFSIPQQIEKQYTTVYPPNMGEVATLQYTFYCNSAEKNGNPMKPDIDTSGNGTKTNPWRDVNYALDRLCCLWTIYKRAFINGESREVIARELEIGSATVSRVIQFLRSHLIAGDTIKRGRKKKIAKK